ncbi:monovalent cation/H(+) antiporter subunit G [Salinispirillum marinum]|uniref:Monovalent cation/H(+) antiporter subunit G n=2 Tax=Saccharospirillaceae TaxID=255527 RepID=A0ABV8BIG7_9GAMM
MINAIIYILLLAGALFMLLASIGLLRFPDLPTRMHATTKAGALGTSLIMVALAVYFAEVAVTARVIAIIGFILLTSPVAGHVIGRAGYFVGVPLWEGTIKDRLKENYDPETHYLRSGFEGMDEQEEDEKTNKTS